MPSLYEPCGLTQMYAFKYGTVPVVRGTGGLEDTVSSFDPPTRRGNGFKFYDYDAFDFLQSVREAVRLYGKRSGLGAIDAKRHEDGFFMGSLGKSIH